MQNIQIFVQKLNVHFLHFHVNKKELIQLISLFRQRYRESVFFSSTSHKTKNRRGVKMQFNFMIIILKLQLIFIYFAICNQTPMKILKTKISAKFLILLLLVQMRYTSTAFMRVFEKANNQMP